ncbi:SDR family NAD(P)-dependent oxidoreductase [Chloroflexota bacterium]
MRLTDKVCIITGAGMGIGRAAALLFAREGAKVVVADILVKEGSETVDMIKAAGGDSAFVQVDVSKAPEAAAMAEFAVDTYGRVNVLYNNAAIVRNIQDNMVAELPEEIWDEILNVNLKGTFLCCKYTVPELIKSGGGSIINTSSICGLVGFEIPAYSASKAGVIALTKVIAREYGLRNVRANVICPGLTETAQRTVSKQAREIHPPVFPYQDSLLGRVAQPEEIAYLPLYLASDESSFVTGAVFTIDGGWTAV